MNSRAARISARARARTGRIVSPGAQQFSTALSLRYMSDDWGVRSDTAQLHLRWSLSNRDRYIEPTFRWYRQTAADFYTPFILNTADSRPPATSPRILAWGRFTR